MNFRHSIFAKIFLRIKAVHKLQYKQIHFDKKIKKRLVLFIILLMIISQLAITIYLPSMPGMASYFHTNPAHIQLSFTLYLVGYGVSQFFYGPLSDIYGRRLIILCGVSFFILATLICIFSPNVSIFLAGRILQGLGIGCGDTMGRAILCDKFKDNEFVKAACQIGMAATITPMAAPIIGGYVETWLDWKINFVIMLIYGLVVAGLIMFYLPETKPAESSSIVSFRGILNVYLFILKNRVFLGFFIPGLVSFIGENIYNMMSPFLIQQQLHWTPIEYGWLTVFTIFGLLAGTLIADRLSHRVSHHTMVLAGVCLLSFSAIMMLMPSLFHHMSIISIVLPMIIFMAGVGITYPNTNMGALTPFTATAGTAGALQGGLQMMLGGAFGSWLGEIPIENQFPLALTLTIISVLGLLGFLILLWPERRLMKKTSLVT